MSYKKQEVLSSSTVFDGVRVAHCSVFLCCVFYFVCLRPVSCLPNVDGFPGFFILDCPFVFFLTFIDQTLYIGTLLNVRSIYDSVLCRARFKQDSLYTINDACYIEKITILTSCCISLFHY